jgi:cbb3-type cytochrome oxidase subunit 1
MLYLLVGISLGIAMGASQNFTMRPVHAHINLIGWTTMALAGLIYTVFPKAGDSKLAAVHFWLFNLALPVMMASLAMALTGRLESIPFLVASEITLAAGVLAFAANIFVNVHQQARVQ